MSLNVNDFESIMNNPNAVVYKALDELSNSGYEITNPDNAFTFLLEYSAILSQGCINKFKEELRKVFPSLANNISDLYPHINNDYVSYLFAKPGSAYFAVYINIMQLKSAGVKKDNYVETVIPANTIIANGDIVSFLVTNDVRIRVYNKTEKVEVMSIANSSSIADNSTGLIETVTLHNRLSIPTLKFYLNVKQITKFEYSKTIVKYETTKITHTLTHKFHTAEVYLVNNTTRAETKLELSFTTDYLNSDVNTVYIEILDGIVTFKLPNLYSKYNGLSGTLKVIVYETKGAEFLPLYNKKASDFSVTYAKENSLNNDTITTEGLCVFSTDDKSVYSGGNDSISFEDLKTKIISNSFNKQLPITEYDIEALGENDGFNITKIEDTLSGRAYIANKGLDAMHSNVMKSIPDVFNNICKVILEDFKNAYPNYISSDQNTFYIPSKSLFRNVSGYTKILTPTEIEYINALDTNTLIRYLKENKIFYNPFYYVINTKDNYSESKVYHLDTPSVNWYMIRESNNNIPNGVTASLGQYSILKTEKGYRLMVCVDGNAAFTEINNNYINMQVTLYNQDNIPIYFLMKYDNTTLSTPFWYLDIETDFKISTDKLEILNGESVLGNKYMSFTSNFILHCYITDPNRFENTNFLVDEIYIENPNTVVLFKGEMEIKFGEELTYMWNRLYNTFTERKYLTYNADLPKRYTEDVYAKDLDGNPVYELSKDGNQVTMVKLHSKGDLMQDTQGNTLYEYKKGDIVYQNGEPIIDKMSGVVRNIEMLMLEYEYMVGNDPISKRIAESATTYIYSLLINSLSSMNSRLLEKTAIYYRGNKRTLPISASLNGVESSLPFNLSPKVKLYVTKDTTIKDSDLTVYRKSIGSILNKWISNKTEILMKDLIDEIFTTISNNGIKGISIYGITDEELNNITFLSNDKPVIAKRLIYNVSKQYEVEYDIDIDVVRMV